MRRVLLALPLLLSGCVDFQNQYAPGRARWVDGGPDPRGLKSAVEMKDPTSLAHFAWGINPAAFDGEKRKTEPKAALRFAVAGKGGRKFKMDFFSAQPQTVKIRVNGQWIGEVQATGNATFEAAAEGSLFVDGTATLVEIWSDVGVSLYRAGFSNP